MPARPLRSFVNARGAQSARNPSSASPRPLPGTMAPAADALSFGDACKVRAA